MCLKFFAILFLSFAVGGTATAAKIDKQSLCELESNGLPKRGPQIVVVYDLSDPYPQEVLQNLITRLNVELGGSKPESRLTLFVFDHSKAFHASVPVDSLCLAGDYSRFNILAPNKNILSKRKRQESSRVEAFLNEYNPKASTVGSPIVDAFISAVTSQTVTTVAEEISVFVISDLVEYSHYANLHDTPISASQASRLAETIAIRIPNFKNISKLTFLYVKRERYRAVQNKALELFWRSLMDSRGIKSISFESIQ